MNMRKIQSLGIELSAFGLGCMRVPMTKNENGIDVVDEKVCTDIIRTAIDGGVNYIDTAYVYSSGMNEEYVGKALRDGYREKVYIATKLPVWECHGKEDMYRLFEEQCRRLGTDVIDFYLAHALDRQKWDKCVEWGIKDFFDDLKAKGRIKYACFSFHDSYDAFEHILCDYSWDMCQIQFNYMDVDNQAGLKGLKLAGSKNIPVVIMEGLLGGRLANVPGDVKALFDAYPVKRSPAEWAFRWLCNYSEVATVLSGTTSVEMTLDNIRIFNDAHVGCMSEEELEIIEKARETYVKRIKINCTGCGYCMPCPAGVDIPKSFAMWNNSFKYDIKDYHYKRLKDEGHGADRCVGCKKCMKICPQHLNIPDALAETDKYFNS